MSAEQGGKTGNEQRDSLWFPWVFISTFLTTVTFLRRRYRGPQTSQPRTGNYQYWNLCATSNHRAYQPMDQVWGWSQGQINNHIAPNGSASQSPFISIWNDEDAIRKDDTSTNGIPTLSDAGTWEIDAKKLENAEVHTLLRLIDAYSIRQSLFERSIPTLHPPYSLNNHNRKHPNGNKCSSHVTLIKSFSFCY